MCSGVKQIKSGFCWPEKQLLLTCRKYFFLFLLIFLACQNNKKKCLYVEPTLPLYYVSQYDSLGLSLKLKDVGQWKWADMEVDSIPNRINFKMFFMAVKESFE